MIDIGLTKLALIGVVALVVIGPEKLPKVARMAGTLFGRAQRYINQVKSEVSREMELEELRKMQQEVQQTASEVERSIAGNISQTQDVLHSAWHDGGGTAGPELSVPPDPAGFAAKARNFRRKKLAHVSSVPTWYKQQNGRRTRVVSAAARVARYRPAGMARKNVNFFH